MALSFSSRFAKITQCVMKRQLAQMVEQQTFKNL